MYFGGDKNFPDVALNPKLLWEFNLSDLDYNEMLNVVVQRVIERGWPEDWYFILNQ